jgi:hypothetical protein
VTDRLCELTATGSIVRSHVLNGGRRFRFWRYDVTDHQRRCLPCYDPPTWPTCRPSDVWSQAVYVSQDYPSTRCACCDA